MIYEPTLALDFGCGVGRCTPLLSKYFEQVVGVDIAESMIRQAIEFNRCSDKLSYIQTDDPELQGLESNCFSFVHPRIVIQHIHPTYSRRYLKSFARIFRTNGILYVQIPSSPPNSLIARISHLLPRCLLNLYRKFRDGNAMDMHWLEPEQVIAWMEDAGMEKAVPENKRAG